MEKYNSEFRTWVRYIWAECVLERESLGLSTIDSKEYFSKYKYWLKREFQHRKDTNTLYG